MASGRAELSKLYSQSERHCYVWKGDIKIKNYGGKSFNKNKNLKGQNTNFKIKQWAGVICWGEGMQWCNLKKGMMAAMLNTSSAQLLTTFSETIQRCNGSEQVVLMTSP